MTFCSSARLIKQKTLLKTKTMKRLIGILLLACITLGAHAQLLWKISGNGLSKPSYLFGTYHLSPLSIKDSIAIKPDFDPYGLLTDPFGPFIGGERIEAKVWIAPEQVQYVKERKWPDTVTITDNKDGSVTFEVVTYGEREFVNWILSMRTQAELLEPAWLRNKVSAILDQTATLYHTL